MGITINGNNIKKLAINGKKVGGSVKWKEYI